MNDDKLPATASTSGTGDALRQAATRTVGVYERPAGRARLSLPLLLIMILAALVSVVLTARFLF